MSDHFTLVSRVIAIGDPMTGLTQVAVPKLLPGEYRLDEGALIPASADADEAATLNVAGNYVFVLDGLLGDRFTANYRQLVSERSGDVAAIQLQLPKMEKDIGARIARYWRSEVATTTSSTCYRLDASKIAPIHVGAGSIIRMIGATLLLLLGTLSAALGIGCIIQHFVDPNAIWDRDPVRGVIEPISWAVNALFFFSGGVLLRRRKYWLVMLCVAANVGVIVVMNLLYGI